MSDGVIVAIITSATSLLLAVVNVIVAAVKNRKDKKSGVEKKLDRIEERLDGIEATQKKQNEHDNLQYMSILRLTVMDSDMPMSERLIAGKEYLHRGGNGDVKAYYENLEWNVNK